MTFPPKVLNPVQVIRALLKDGRYGFALHAKQRLEERNVTVQELVQVIRRGVHDPEKDVFRIDFKDWNYAIVGQTVDGRKMRLAVSIKADRFLVVTVIDFGRRGRI